MIRAVVACTLAVLLVAAAWSPRPVRADAVVGTGTADSCTEAALNAALGCGAPSGSPPVSNCTGGGSVTFNCGASPVTITVTNQKTIAADTSIDGSGLITLSGGGASRVFYVNSGVNITIANLTILNGNSAYWGGAIYNSGTLALTNSIFSGNSANAVSGFGGAVYNFLGTLSIANSAFSGNSAGWGGAIYYNRGSTLTITNSTFSGNSASDSGGAIGNDATLTVTNSTFSGNSAADGGGGIWSEGTLTVTNSAFSGNSTTFRGGAIANDAALTVTNSTFSDNTALDGGGAIYGTLEVTNSTFSGNGYCAIYCYGALTVTNTTFFGNSGAICGYGQASTVQNTIIANSDLPPPSDVCTGGQVTCVCSGNQFMACGGPGGDATCAQFGAGTCVPKEHGNCSGTITDGGHNLDDGTTCGFSTTNGSLSNADPDLDPAGLASNGGPTQTIALQAGSPAINAGDETICAAPPVNNLDQRRFVRPGVGAANCSIGAYEYGSPGTSDCCQCPTSCAVPVNGSCGSCILVFGATCKTGELCLLHTPTPTPTVTATATVTPTPTATPTPTPTPTSTPTSPSPTPTSTATSTPGPNDCCQCADFCAAPIVGTCGGCTVVFAASCAGGGLCTSQTAPTQTVTRSVTATATSTLVPTATASQTAAPTNTVPVSPTETLTPTPTHTPTPTGTSTPPPTSTAAATLTATNTPTPTPTDTPTVTAAPTNTGTPAASPTATPTLTDTDTPTQTPTVTLTPTETSTPTCTATITAAATVPTVTPTPTETVAPTSTPTIAPAATSTTTATPTTTTATPTSTPRPCAGDCNGDGSVTVDEILTMVNIALGNLQISDCLPGDVSGDGQITVDEILTAVNNALNGCGGS